jgi:hypothetical protein
VTSLDDQELQLVVVFPDILTAGSINQNEFFCEIFTGKNWPLFMACLSCKKAQAASVFRKKKLIMLIDTSGLCKVSIDEGVV